MLDAGSNFHVAAAAPASTSEAFLESLQRHWIAWAGPPNEMTVDSGTEINSAKVEEFIQQFGVKFNTICPEAHWQNGKAERHGSFLQAMLTKVDREHPVEL